MKILQRAFYLFTIIGWVASAGLSVAAAQVPSNGSSFNLSTCLSFDYVCRLSGQTVRNNDGSWSDPSGNATGQINLSLSPNQIGDVPGLRRYVTQASIFYTGANPGSTVTVYFGGVGYTFNATTSSTTDMLLTVNRWMGGWQDFYVTNARAVLILLYGDSGDVATFTPTPKGLGTLAYPTATAQAAYVCGVFNKCDFITTPTAIFASNVGASVAGGATIPILYTRQSEIDQANSIINMYRFANSGGLISIVFVLFSLLLGAAIFITLFRRISNNRAD